MKTYFLFLALFLPLTLPLVEAASEPTATPAPWRFSFGPSEVRPEYKSVDPHAVYSSESGFGFDLKTAPTADGKPFYFSVTVPEGTYKVTVTLGDAKESSATTVKAESRQLMLEHIETKPGEFVTRDFLVNVRNSRIPPPPKNAPGGSAVVLNDRETGIFRWDDKLTLEFDGPVARVASLVIEPASAPVVFLAGDSTVTDQSYEPGASWGQMLPRFLTGVAVANHAESGETLKSFITGLRLAKLLSQIKSGDYLFIQFAHNDEKVNWPQTYVDAATTYKAYLRVFIAEAKLRGAIPVLVSPLQRRSFDAQGKIKNTHRGYPQAVREVAAEEHVALIDLEKMSIALFEALGPAKAPLAFSAHGKDITHQDDYGAYELAKCVAQGIREAKLPLAQNLVSDFPNFDPAHPDDPDSFTFAESILHSSVTPRGN